LTDQLIFERIGVFGQDIQPDTELRAALQVMDCDGVNQLPVMATGQILGMLTRDGIISFLRTLRELGR
jgi:predicted transcriptional regulator